MYFKRILIASLLSTSAISFASTPVSAVEGIDTNREGNLASKVEEFYKTTDPLVGCDVNELSRVQAFKMSSSSSHESKQLGTPTDYEANYLVTKVCFVGTTFVGAYRKLSKAVIISANRRGVEDVNGMIIPNVPDQFSVIKTLEVKTLVGIE